MFLKCAHGSESLVRRRMAAMLGTIRRWTPDEIAYLKANYGPKTATEIAVTLKRSKQSVLLKCMTIGLRLTAEQTTRARSLGRPDQTGENNPCWKGGVSKINYRYTKRFRNKSRDKTRAHDRVRYALATGRLTKQPCQVCGCEKSESHHHDYSKPLEVEWLCRTHHIAADKARRERERQSSPNE